MQNRYAVVDIGSNTVRLVVYDRLSDGKISRVIGEKSSLGLINYISDGIMQETGIRRLVDTMTQFSVCAMKVDCEMMMSFATASLRGIENSDEVLRRVYEGCGASIEILSGEEEANLNFEGLKTSFNLTDGIMIDMGGGSTEVLSFENAISSELASLPFGSLKLYRKFVSGILPTQQEAVELSSYVNEQVMNHPWICKGVSTAYAIGGTARAASRVYAAVTGGIAPDNITLEQLIMLYNNLMSRMDRACIMLVEQVPDRLHTFIPGLIGLIEILQIAGVSDVQISSCGVREGYLLRRMSANTI